MSEAFDTHKAFLELTDSDCFPTNQAEKLVTLLNSAIIGNVATKTDLDSLEKTLRAEMDSHKSELKIELNAVRSELKTEMTAVRSELKTEMKSHRSEIREEVAKYRLQVILWVLSGTGVLMLAREVLDRVL